MKILFTTVLFFILICSVLSAENDKEYYKHYQKAQVYLKNKLYKDAVEEYKKAGELNQDFKKVYLKLGIIYDQYLHDYKNAIVYYLKYIEHGGERVEEIKRWVDNIANLKVVTTKKQFAKFKKAVEYYNKGVKLAKKRKFPDAVNWFKKSLKIAPFYAKAHYSLGIAYFTMKKYDRAFVYFLNTIKFSPDTPALSNAYYYLGILYDDLFLKDYDKAYLFYKKYIEVGGDKTKQANNLIKPIIEVNDYMREAVQFAQKKEFSESIALLKKALKLKEFDVRIYNNMASVYILQNKLDDALHILKKSLAIRDDVGETYYNLACVYSKKNNVKRALLEFKKGLNFYSKNLLKHALKDDDLKNLSVNKEFKKIILERIEFDK